MGFTFKTQYNQKSIAAMAKGIRKTIRKKKSRRSHILGVIIIAIVLLLTAPVLKGEADININTIITWIAAIIMAIVLIFEDMINGYIARKRMLAGLQNSTTFFEDDKYTITTDFGKTEFNYTKINSIVETDEYFIFVFDISHAQIYDKTNMTGGSVEDFRTFIKDKTSKDIIFIK